MSAERKKSALPLYVIVLIGAAVVVLYVFLRNYHAGEEAASVAPPPTEPVGGAAKIVDERALAKDMNLAAKGKQLFEINCSSCHGPQGYGDGPRAASINPKPRNYHTEKFKFGDDIVSIHNTIMKGSPGTSMPSFALLPLEDTWAIAHYVYTLIPNPPPVTDAQLAQLPGGPSGGGSTAPATATAGSTATAQATATPDTTKQKTPKKGSTTPAPAPAPTAADTTRIPIEIAMQRMISGGPVVPPPQQSKPASTPGAAIFAERCARCHGASGEGKLQHVLAVAPYRYEVTEDLSTSESPWVTDRNKFSEIVVQGLPGRTMPGQATLTSTQIDELYTFVRSLTKGR